MKDTWFALAELAFSCVWLVVHSTYGLHASALYTHFRGVWDGAWPQIFHALTVNYSPPTLNLLPTPMISGNTCLAIPTLCAGETPDEKLEIWAKPVYSFQTIHDITTNTACHCSYLN